MQNFPDQSQFKISLLIVVGSLLLLCACTPKSKIEPLAGYGSNPVLPAPNKELLPTVNIAPAIGWSNNAKPTAGQGLLVKVFANQLQHPRWLYVLPNGDVLVAETNAPSSSKRSFSLSG